MSPKEGQVCIPLADAMELFRDMQEFVVSLDRIRSRIAFGADPQILVDYVVDREVFQRLAKARGLFADLVASEIGEEQMEEMAEAVPVYPDFP